ncbi:hypothetical protein ADH76_19900 [Enterocloster clostridioformis]|nr:hypothetical protein [Enterocloster clostridioformis]ANU47560.1 hypothetical protein A4V08_18945 [Lachnoclostridium sp. YL32]NDO30806.1 hypothetical protein [Enterocloster clostridioformis]OXE66249.1 hypothetical protein ADH76_19900 [Enterocloster clostridioformis]QQR03543.1 hypothetical protein I5Q83_15895 [Enterocloster clostridioformis]
MKQVFGKTFKYVDELYLNVIKEIKFGEGNELNDNEALKYLQELHTMSGKLHVITDICYEKKCGPFVVDANMIDKFIDTFYSTYGQAFYSTDIVIINFEQKLIWVLFHEGVCWLSEG